MNNRTYTETQNYAPFDWNQALSKSEITEKDWNIMASRTSSWVTCAVGNQCTVIPRDEQGEPIDDDLCIDGIGFMVAIKKRDVEDAKAVLARIERRSAELIAEYYNK